MAAKFSLGSIQLLTLKQQLWRVQRHLSKRLLLLEFTADSLLVAQFQLRPKGLRFCGFARESLPGGAVERGVPSDPKLMAELISSLCKEQLLVAHRAMVVLPPEAVHCSSHWLPADLEKSELQHKLLQPAPPVLLPFPLGQTDFDVLPHGTFGSRGSENLQLWTILAVASRLSDRLLQCLQLADQECERIELSALSLSRLAQPHLAGLASGQTALVLDFDRDQTHVVVASSEGPLLADRLTAIRAYPHGDPDAQDSYMPLSEIDLQAFVADLNHLIEHLQNDAELPQVVSKIVVTGMNSAHPDLVGLLGSLLSIPVIGISLFDINALDGLDQLALTESCFFHRIVGAAISLVPDLALEAVAPLTVPVAVVASLDLAGDESIDPVESPSQDLPVDEQEQALEAAMYHEATIGSEPTPDTAETPSSPSFLESEQADNHQEEGGEQPSDLTAAEPPLILDSQPLLLTDTPAPPVAPVAPKVTPTDDPTTWPSIGKRRARSSPAQTSTPTEAAPPWNEPASLQLEDLKESAGSSLFSFSADQGVEPEPETASNDTPSALGIDPQPEASDHEDAGSGLFSFASDPGLASEAKPRDVVIESDSDSGYSLGLGEP